MSLRSQLTALMRVPQALVLGAVAPWRRGQAETNAWLRGEDISGSFAGGQLARYREPAYSGHSFAHACMRILYQAASAVPWKLWQRQTGPKKQEVEEDDLLTLFNDPFPELYASGPSFFAQLVLYWIAGGNAWIMRDPQVNPRTGLPISLMALGREHVEAIRERTSGRAIGWEITIGTNRFRVPLEALDHLKFPCDPQTGELVYGIGPLQAVQRGIDSDFAAMVWNGSFYTNFGSVGTVLSYMPQRQTDSPWLTKQQRSDLKEAFLEDHRGAARAHGLHVLQGPFDLKQLGMSQKDADFLNSRKFTRDEVATVFGVPPVLLSTEGAGLTDAAQKTARRMLYENTVLPMLTILQAVLQRRYVDVYRPKLVGEFATDEIPALREDEDRTSQIVQRYAEMGWPINALNKRFDLGFEDVPWGDDWWIPFSKMPASAVGQPMPRALPGDAEPVLIEGPDGRLMVAHVRRAPARLEDPSGAPPAPVLAPPAEPAVPAIDRRLIRWRAFAQTFAPLEEAYSGKVRRHFFRLRQEVLANLNAQRVGRVVTRDLDDDVEAVLFDDDAAAERLRDLSRPYFEQAIRIGAEGAAADVGASAIGLDAPAARAFLALKEIRVVRINDTIREALRAQLFEGFNAGENLSDVAARVRGVFNVGSARARTIARTEIGQAVNGGRYVELRSQGVERHQWLSAGDETVRKPPDSDYNHAIDEEEVAVGDSFSNGLRYPGDPEGDPGNIINAVLPGTRVAGAVLLAFRARYAGQIIEIVTASGRRLSVTAEHQVLTPHGFVAARSLCEGDEVIAEAFEREDRRVGAGALAKARAGMPQENHHQNPTLIEDVFRTLAQAGRIRALPVVSDFHGDGRRMQGEVDIVAADGRLLRHLQALLAQGDREVVLERAAMGQAATTGTRSQTLNAVRVALSTTRGPGVQAQGFGNAPDAHASRYEAATQRRLVDADFLRNLFQAAPGLVAPDRILKIERRLYVGHVYDLQTVGGWFAAGNTPPGNPSQARGVIAANCRCTVVPV